jgi:hypothetical protein
MATTYDITRLEITKDREGNDEVFVVTEIYDDTEGVITIPKWYQADMAKAIIDDHKKVGNDRDKALHDHIKKTMNAHVASARIRRENPEKPTQ